MLFANTTSPKPAQKFLKIGLLSNRCREIIKALFRFCLSLLAASPSLSVSRISLLFLCRVWPFPCGIAPSPLDAVWRNWMPSGEIQAQEVFSTLTTLVYLNLKAAPPSPIRPSGT